MPSSLFVANLLVCLCRKVHYWAWGRIAKHGSPSLQVSNPASHDVASSPMLIFSAELAPPEVRGSLVALQQLAIAFGIMVSFWIDYGTNYIGGTGPTQSEAAWRIPIALQIVPALILGFGILFMPFSPRHAFPCHMFATLNNLE